MNSEPLLNVIEVAAAVGVCRKSITNWTRRKGMPAFTYPGRKLPVYLASSVRRWVAEQDWIRVTLREEE